MRELVIARLSRLFNGWLDLVAALPEEALSRKLPVASNSIGEQLWCVVGARESYGRAITAGEWQGFSCSLSRDGIASQAEVLSGLRRSAEQVMDQLGPVEWTAARDGLLLDLLEHEAQHQGQLIRYVYGLGYSFPASWRERWSLN